MQKEEQSAGDGYNLYPFVLLRYMWYSSTGDEHSVLMCWVTSGKWLHFSLKLSFFIYAVDFLNLLYQVNVIIKIIYKRPDRPTLSIC